jgi:hypothetical protein
MCIFEILPPFTAEVMPKLADFFSKLVEFHLNQGTRKPVMGPISAKFDDNRPKSMAEILVCIFKRILSILVENEITVYSDFF